MGRVWRWFPPKGDPILLSNFPDYWVLRGVLGMWAPVYTVEAQVTPGFDGARWRGARAEQRPMFLPMRIKGIDRRDMLDKRATLIRALNPKLGPGYLQCEDEGSVRRIQCYYTGGMEGDEGEAAEFRNEFACKFGLNFLSTDPAWEDSNPNIFSWSGTASLPFFPFFPLRVSSTQLIPGGGTDRHNKITNPSFEVSLSDWAIDTTPVSEPTSIVQDNTTANKGTQCMRINWGADGTDDQIVRTQVTGLTVGITYELFAAINNGTTDTVYVGVQGASSVDVSNAFNGAWTTYRVSFVATATSHHMVIAKRAGTASGTTRVDTVMWTDGPPDTSYIDGDQSGCVWDGTPHLSSSTLLAAFIPANLVNVGDQEAYPVWTMVGPFTAVQALNIESGRVWKIQYPASAGEVITLDTRWQSQSVTSSSGANLWGSLESDDLWPLNQDDNHVQLITENSGSGTSVSASWVNRYGSAS